MSRRARDGQVLHAPSRARLAAGSSASARFRDASSGDTRFRTDPPGATVIVNGEEIGPSPASKSFVFYGERKITMILDGYQTKTVIQPINAPGGIISSTEFFTENFLPVSLRDDQEFTYKLEPFQTAPQGELRDRGGKPKE